MRSDAVFGCEPTAAIVTSVLPARSTTQGDESMSIQRSPATDQILFGAACPTCIGGRRGCCRSVRVGHAIQPGRIDALQIQFWPLTSWAIPWRTEDMIIGIVGARTAPDILAGQFSGGSWMEGRSTADDGHWPVLRTEIWRWSVPIRCCGMRWPQKPEWTGHVCCSKSFKLGSVFKLGVFKTGSNSVRTLGGTVATLRRLLRSIGRRAQTHQPRGSCSVPTALARLACSRAARRKPIARVADARSVHRSRFPRSMSSSVDSESRVRNGGSVRRRHRPPRPPVTPERDPYRRRAAPPRFDSG